MIDPALIDLNNTKTLREHLVDLVEHFSECYEATKDFPHSAQMQNMGEELAVTAHYLKRLVSREFNREFYGKEINDAIRAHRAGSITPQ